MSAEAKKDNLNRRSRMGFLVDPERQLRFSFMLIGGGITACMLFTLYLLIALESSIQDVLVTGGVSREIRTVLLDHVSNAELNVSAICLLLLMLSVAMGIRLSHRIYGPVVQIRGHIRQLIHGNFASRVKLRDEDHFVEVADDLNLLAETLEKGKR